MTRAEPAPNRGDHDVAPGPDVPGRRTGRRVAAILSLSASGILAAVTLGGVPNAATSAPFEPGAAGLMLSAAFLVGGLLLARRGRPKEG